MRSQTQQGKQNRTGAWIRAKKARRTPSPATLLGLTAFAVFTAGTQTAFAENAGPTDAAAKTTASENQTSGETLASSADPAQLLRLDLRGVRFQFSPLHAPEFRRLQNGLIAGITDLQAKFGNPGLDEDRQPRYTIAARPGELAAAMRAQLEDLPPGEVELALRLGVYADGSEIFVLCPEDVRIEDALRSVLIDYADRLATQISSGRNRQLGWFGAGLAAYYGWRAAGPLYERSVPESEAAMQQYYARNYPKDAEGLANIETHAKWQAALAQNPEATYARAALAYLILAREVGPASGVSALRILERPDRFGQAFERATGLRLFEFEQRLAAALPEILAHNADRPAGAGDPEDSGDSDAVAP